MRPSWSDDGSAPWNIMQYPSFPNSDLIMTARLINRDGQYYVNTYDPDKMYDDGYMYLVYEYEDNPVSQAEYEAAWHGFGLDSDAVRSIEESEVYRIVPEVIQEVFACD